MDIILMLSMTQILAGYNRVFSCVWARATKLAATYLPCAGIIGPCELAADIVPGAWYGERVSIVEA